MAVMIAQLSQTISATILMNRHYSRGTAAIITKLENLGAVLKLNVLLMTYFCYSNTIHWNAVKLAALWTVRTA
ncbi:hypothetical protein [Bacillus subtilis]|uniref:hypothetical protein n=1 Tax=Bacillus subtilis TaxID=1423 RepID=UPI0007AF88A6|nr:hypothetical protein [Bacillus subtilis]MDX7996710.1 hypothetical protein [Bacillus subtilis]